MFCFQNNFPLPDVPHVPFSRNAVREKQTNKPITFFGKSAGASHGAKTPDPDGPPGSPVPEEIDLVGDGRKADDEEVAPLAHGAEMQLDVDDESEAGDHSFSGGGGNDVTLSPTLSPSPKKRGEEEVSTDGVLTTTSKGNEGSFDCEGLTPNVPQPLVKTYPMTLHVASTGQQTPPGEVRVGRQGSSLFAVPTSARGFERPGCTKTVDQRGGTCAPCAGIAHKQAYRGENMQVVCSAFAWCWEAGPALCLRRFKRLLTRSFCISPRFVCDGISVRVWLNGLAKKRRTKLLNIFGMHSLPRSKLKIGGSNGNNTRRATGFQ